MQMTKAGFDVLRQKFRKLTQSQVDEINFIVSEINKDNSINYPQAAYILATIWHETDSSMLPIVEYGKGKNKTYGTWYLNSKKQKYSFKNGKKKTAYLFSEFPHLYYGRGYVQLTWFDNYELASKKLGIDFLRNPELVCQKESAIKIAIVGMQQGWFTTRKLKDYIHQSKKDYKGARYIINGSDRCELIAGYAETFEKALRSY